MRRPLLHCHLPVCAVLVGMAGLGTSMPAEAACMTKQHAPKSGSPVTLTALVPTAQIPDFSAAGYAIVTCSGDPQGLTRLVKHYCAPSADNRAPLPVILRIYGFSRERLCAAARAGQAESPTP